MPQHDSGAFEPLELWRNAREPTFWLDAELRLAWVNQAWEALTGHRSKAVVGLMSHAHAPTRGDDLADLAASLHPPPESLAGEPCGTKTLIFSAGGERIWRRVEFWPFRDQKLALIGLLGVIREPNDRPGAIDTQANRLHVELLEVRHSFTGPPVLTVCWVWARHTRLLEQVRLAALATTPVLIVGEPGTGKRHVARVIHQNSPGRNQPLIAFDPEVLPPEVLERELFAAEHDPESPAHAPDAGRPRLKLGEGSSLLIREIFMLPRDLQARLAASLDQSIRLIGTSVLDPEMALSSDRARPDLYYALDGARDSLATPARPPRRAADPGAVFSRACESARRRAAKRFLAPGARSAFAIRLARQPGRAGARNRPRPRAEALARVG